MVIYLFLFKDEILFQSDLKKMLNVNVPSQKYISVFAVITKVEFKCFKSKEQFLTLKKHSLLIPFYQIEDVIRIKSNPNLNFFDHFCLKLKCNNEDNLEYINNSSNDISKSFFIIYF